MPTRPLSSPLSAKAAAERLLLAHADAAALAVDRALVGVWDRLRAVLRQCHGYPADYRRALAVLRPLPQLVAGTLGERLHALYRRGHGLAARGVVGTLTVGAMQRLVTHDALKGHARGKIERTAQYRKGAAVQLGEGQISHRRARGLDLDNHSTGRVIGILEADETPGLLTLTADPLGELLARFLGPRLPQTRSAWERLVQALLFPPPPEEVIWRALAPLVRPDDWQAVGDAQRKLPRDLADALASGLAQGKSQRAVAEDLRPYLEGSRVRARRAARTFGLHVAHAAQMEAYQGLGAHVIGYQVHAVVDEWTRSWHLQRDGTVYYKQPQPGQKGMHQMPRPPFEADDPGERPAKAGKLAFH